VTSPEQPTMTLRRRLIAAAIVLMVGSLAPWASVLGLASASGLAVGFGWLTLLAGTAVLTIALDLAWLARLGWLRACRRRVLLTLGVVSIIDCLLVILGAAHSQYGAAIGPEWGVFLTLAAAIGVVALARDPADRQAP
jgi:hypothetical protein